MQGMIRQLCLQIINYLFIYNIGIGFISIIMVFIVNNGHCDCGIAWVACSFAAHAPPSGASALFASCLTNHHKFCNRNVPEEGSKMKPTKCDFKRVAVIHVTSYITYLYKTLRTALT